LSDKDQIKELFQKELGNYRAKVNPSIWNSVQSSIGVAGTAVGTTIGGVAKIGIGVAVATAITVAIVLNINNSKENTPSKDQVENKILQDSSNKESKQSTPLISSKDDKETINKNTEKLTSDDNREDNKVDKSDKNREGNSSIVSSKDQQKDIKGKQETDKTSLEKENTNAKHKTTTNNPQSTTVSSGNENTSNSGKNENKIKITPLHFQPAIVKQKNQFVSFEINNLPENATVLWNFGDGNYERNGNPEHFYANAGAYTVQVTVEKGKQKKIKTLSLTIEVQGKLKELSNIFTPNGDGENDVFFIESEHIKEFQVTIMDTKQNTVFTSNSVDFKWNGLNLAGEPVSQGNYIYIIVAKDDAGNVINKYKQLHLQR